MAPRRKTMRGGYVVEVHNQVQVTKLISTHICPNVGEAVLSSTTLPHPLCLAMKQGNVDIVDLLIKAGADVRLPFDDFLPLFFALNNKDCQVELVKLVIDAGFPKDAFINGITQETSLHLAVSMNHICVVKYLLSISADINVIDIQGLSPLHIAVKKGNSAMIDLLIRHGEANLNCESKNGYTPLFFAIACGNCEIVELLISLGADIHYVNSNKHKSMMPLHFGALMGQLKVTQLLLEKGAEVNKQNPNTGEIALHAAARANTFIDERSRISLSCITEILIKLGSNLKTKQKDGLTPLQVAVNFKNPIVTKLLIMNGSELNDTIAHNGDKGLTTTTFHIISKMFSKEIIELAIEYGADVLKTNEDGLYPCHFVLMASLMHVISHRGVCTRDKSQCGFVDDPAIYKLFWKHGFPYDLTLKMKWVNSCEPPFPPSILALVQKQKLFFSGVKHQKIRLVQKALSQGAEVHCCSTEIPFPLHYTASKGNDIILKEFLSRGVKVNSLDKRGNSPLHLAARAGSTICCQMLLEYGAVYNYTSSDGPKTPLEVAKEKGHCEVVALLESVDNIFKGLTRNNFNQLIKPDMGILLAVMNCCDLNGLTLLGNALKYGLDKKAAFLLNLRFKLTSEEDRVVDKN